MDSLMEMLAVMSVFYGAIGIFAIVLYVLQALALQTIASRRGIAHAWLAWVPVGCVWLIGAIADDYRLKAKGEKKNRRALLLWTSLACLLLLAIVYGSIFGTLFQIIEVQTELDDLGTYYFGSSDWEEAQELREELDDLEDELEESALTMVLLMLPMGALSVLMVVFQYICLYDLFNSCDPGTGALYLILSIFVSGLAGILLFVSRNKDLGMRPPVQYAPYGYMPPQYGQPYQQPYQPPYQQPYQQPPQNPPQQGRDPGRPW